MNDSVLYYDLILYYDLGMDIIIIVDLYMMN